MKTVHQHKITAKEVDANTDWNKNLGLVVKDADNEITISVTPAQMQDLIRRGRNALIEAKIIRGKKKYG